MQPWTALTRVLVHPEQDISSPVGTSAGHPCRSLAPSRPPLTVWLTTLGRPRQIWDPRKIPQPVATQKREQRKRLLIPRPLCLPRRKICPAGGSPGPALEQTGLEIMRLRLQATNVEIFRVYGV
ncbi:hypothetical protein VTJ04DRAFT_4680 [Mycothermus thermophilus]|uniref:uncharacterized protein n=1 Tax=Humicola insolens TaxID=85995 RepID=UPI003741F0EC